METILLILYLLGFAFQIILLVKSIKKKNNKYWIMTFVIEIIFIIISKIVENYYNSLPGYGFMPGLTYFGETLLSLGANTIYYIMLFITMLAKIIAFEREQKRQGKKYANPFLLIIALIFIIIGIVSLYNEISYNWDKKETIGTVINFTRIGQNEPWPVISFNVQGKDYEDYAIISNVEIGDNVKVYYYSNDDSYRITPYLANNKIVYIPSLMIGLLIILFRFRYSIFQRRTLNKQT